MMVKTLSFDEAIKTLPLPALQRNLFSSPEWLSVLTKTYRLRFFVKYIEREGHIASYVIYSVVHNFLEEKICVCSYCDYFDCYVEKAQDWELFFEALRQEHFRYRMAIRNLRDETVRQCQHFKVLSKERHHILDIRSDLEAIWKRAHDSFRSPVKQAQKSGVTVRSCDKEGLKKFYSLHLKLRKNKYRLFPQPYRFFENVWEGYVEKDRGVLLGAFDKDNRFIGGTIFLICGNTLYYKFNTSDLKALKDRPNNILLWEGVKFAKARNLEYIDMGSSGYHQDGLILFKDHTGAQSSDIIHLGFTPPDYKFSRKIILNTMTKFFTAPWMPDFLLRWGSGLIYPYLA